MTGGTIGANMTTAHSVTMDGGTLMARSDLVDVSGEVQGETEKAFRFFDGDQHVWLPKSLCEWDPNDKTMTMPEWIAMEKGLI
jgi:hypothetical protein